MNWNAILLSLKLSLITTAVLLVIGLPVAYWIAFSRWRWKFLFESVVAMPLVMPPTVLGFYLLVAMGSASPIGRWYLQLTGSTLAFSFAGLVVGSVIYSLPFAVQPVIAGFSQVDTRLIAAAATLGASRWRTFWRVVLPLSKASLLTGAVLSFAHTMGEFGVVLMVGGNIPGITRTASIAIYDDVQLIDYSSANRTALVLLIFAFVALSVTYAAARRVWTPWASR